MKKWIIRLRYLAWGIAGVSLLWFLIALIWLKSPIGVHFAPDGSFDVFDTKLYGFYPHIINAAIIGISALAESLSHKIRTGMKITEQGEAMLSEIFCLTVALGRLWLVLFFGYWNALVILQKPLITIIPTAVILLEFLGFLVMLFALVIVRIHYGRKKGTDA